MINLVSGSNVKASKTYRVLSALGKPELRELDAQLQAHKRQSMYRLFSLLQAGCIQQQPEPSKEQAFEAIFDKDYQKDDDYLLRHEYRLLFKEIVQFIATKEWLRQPEQLTRIKYLEYLLRTGQDELLEEEINETIGAARRNDDMRLLLALYDLLISNRINSKPQTLANAEDTLKLSLERAGMLQHDILRKLRLEETRMKMSERIIKAYKPDYAPRPFFHTIELMPLQQHDVYAQHLYQRAQTNLADADERINLMQEILSKPEVIEQYEPEPNQAFARFYAILAQEYYIKGAFAQAYGYFEKALPLLKHMSVNAGDAFLFNYLMALLKGGRQADAATIGAQFKKRILNSQTLKNRAAFLYIMLHLFNREPDKAEQFIDLESKAEGTEFYYHMRLALSFVYYLRGQLELADRECYNLEQALNYELRKEGNSQVELDKNLNKLFRKYYALHMEGRAVGARGMEAKFAEFRKNLDTGSGGSVLINLLEADCRVLMKSS